MRNGVQKVDGGNTVLILMNKTLGDSSQRHPATEIRSKDNIRLGRDINYPPEATAA